LLATFAAEWPVDSRSVEHMPAIFLGTLKSLSSAEQYLFNNLLEKLLGSDWTKRVDSVDRSSSYNLPPVLWALRLGPSALASGWSTGVRAETMLIKSERNWRYKKIYCYDCENKNKTLEDFAVALRCWGAKAKKAGCGGNGRK
jgi:hypothetical protein